MATITDGQRFVLFDVGWEGYRTLRKLVGDRAIRLTYDRGNVELMAPLSIHERYKYLVGRMIDVITEEFNIPVMAAGSTTFAREELDRGLEPDQCYYFANFERVSDGDSPDLAIEIDVTSRSLNRLGIYAALRVAEVWRFDGETLEVLRLQAEADDYARSDRSAVLPFLPMNEIASRLLAYEMGNDTAWARSFRTWVRDVLAPQIRGGPIEG